MYNKCGYYIKITLNICAFNKNLTNKYQVQVPIIIEKYNMYQNNIGNIIDF